MCGRVSHRPPSNVRKVLTPNSHHHPTCPACNSTGLIADHCPGCLTCEGTGLDVKNLLSHSEDGQKEKQLSETVLPHQGLTATEHSPPANVELELRAVDRASEKVFSKPLVDSQPQVSARPNDRRPSRSPNAGRSPEQSIASEEELPEVGSGTSQAPIQTEARPRVPNNMPNNSRAQANPNQRNDAHLRSTNNARNGRDQPMVSNTASNRQKLRADNLLGQNVPDAVSSRGKLSTKNVKVLDSAQRAKDGALPKRLEASHSPSAYMKDAWESASTVATSVMSENTRKTLSFFPSRWLDRDQNYLGTCCANGKAAAVRFLLERKCNPGTQHKPRLGPMKAAVKGASKRHTKCVRALIEHDADVNMRNRSDGTTPIHWAIENQNFPGYPQLIRTLIEAGANPNTADLGGIYPLQRLFAKAGGTGPFEKYQLHALACILMSDVSEGVDLDITLPGRGDKLLHMAVSRRDPLATGMLLYKNADVNAKNSSGTTPLLAAAGQWQGELTENQDSILKFLLQKGAVVDERAGTNGRTALHQAIVAGAASAVRILLEFGASPNLTTKDGENALGLASKQASKMDPDAHASIMISILNTFEKPPFMQEGSCVLKTALSRKSTTSLEILLDHGMSARQVYSDKPLLHHVIEGGKLDFVALLARIGASLEDKNQDNEDAIACSRKLKDSKIRDWLVRFQERGKRVARRGRNSTPSVPGAFVD
jgi:ankyrin repeat protein